jgi:hypothetical protein
MGFAQNELIHCADNIRTILDRFDRTRLPSGPGNTGAIPWQRTGTPHGKQKMSIEATRATGKAQEELAYGIERHEAALGRG